MMFFNSMLVFLVLLLEGASAADSPPTEGAATFDLDDILLKNENRTVEKGDGRWCRCDINHLNPHTCVHYTIPDIGEICWTEGGWEMTPVDFETMLCLIDLHTAQKATCIDTKGSKCANKHEELDGPFTAIGGAKKRPHVKILGFPFNPNKARYGKLPAQGAEALKLMIGALYMKGPGFMKFNLNTEIDMRITAHWGKHAKHKFLIRGTGSHDC